MAQLVQKSDLTPASLLATDTDLRSRRITLLDLVAAVIDAAASDDEVIATVHHLIASGRVTLIGQFRDRDVG